jgi:hypothetical protein
MVEELSARPKAISGNNMETIYNERDSEVAADDFCPVCKTVSLKVGYAIDPKWHDSCCHGMGGGPRSLKVTDIDFIFVMKCPECGHCEETDQDDPRFQTPPEPYYTWSAYWRKELPYEIHPIRKR